VLIGKLNLQGSVVTKKSLGGPFAPMQLPQATRSTTMHNNIWPNSERVMLAVLPETEARPCEPYYSSDGASPPPYKYTEIGARR
jgi:hypothetical protein